MRSAAEPPDLGTLLEQHRDKLKRMVRCRLDRRLQGRVDPSDVVQEAYIEAARRFPDYERDPAMPFFLWLRFLAVQQLLIVHRRHLNVKMRSVKRESPAGGGQAPSADLAILADGLSGHFTSPSSAAARKETRSRLAAALEALEPHDREILTLRHFEQLNTAESAQILGISAALA